MTKAKNQQSQFQVGKRIDTEFGAEVTQSKKARKRAARERNNK